MRPRVPIAILLGLVVLTGVADAQSTLSSRPWAANVVVPQGRSFRTHPGAPVVRTTGVTASIEILEQVATTTLTIDLYNSHDRAQQAEILVPVPRGVTVREFAIQGSSAEAVARLLPAVQARRLFASIVAKLRDPGLLQFAGHDVLRSSVFPVPPSSMQQVRIVYEQILPANGDRVDYVLPRTEDLGYEVPWMITARIRTNPDIATVYSPSHPLEVKRPARNVLVAKVPARAIREPGSFQLSFLRSANGVSASLLAYPDPKTGGGTFLLLAGIPSNDGDATPTAIRREVTIVIDRSGSMKGGKLDQVREAALQVLAGLREGERFNVISYNAQIDLFSASPVTKTPDTLKAAEAYLKRLTPQGGTNLHDALVEALRQKPTGEFLPLVLFLTDGLPTVGEQSEVKIRDVAREANPHERRVFTIGVGVDVNTPLLDRIATTTRAKATFILPNEDIEVKVGQVFRRLRGPVLASAELIAMPAENGAPRLREVFPRRLDDVFDGDQLIVLGRYQGDAPLELRLRGNYRGTDRTFRFRFALDKATTRNAFVPRLWASRKIAFLIDAIRDSGADASFEEGPDAVAADPRLKELTDEIVRLSLEYGILTEYTAFLAEVGTDLGDESKVQGDTARNLNDRARGDRAGWAGVNQEMNNGQQRGQVCLNRRNGWVNDRMERVNVHTVQQMGDRAYFLRRGVAAVAPAKEAWVDSRLVSRLSDLGDVRKVERGSAEYERLAQRLAGHGRQGCLALRGNILLLVEGQVILIVRPSA